MKSHGSKSAAPLPQHRIYSYSRAYLATRSWVKHDVNPRQNQGRLIGHLRTTLRDLMIPGIVSLSAICVRASMAFWLRENAGHSKIFAAPFRFTIGRPTHSGSVARLQIGFATGILMAGASEAQQTRIL